MLIASPSQAGFRVLDSFSRIVRLGEGLGNSGLLSSASMDRALAALAACAEKLSRRPLRGFDAVATEACRQARNGPDFIARVEAEIGIRLRIISGREEAELAMESCAPLLGDGDRRALLFDIGGGSTEIAWIRAAAKPGDVPELIGYISLPIGVVTLAERCGTACFTEAGFFAVVDEVAAHLQAFDRLHCIGQEIRAGGVRLMGTSGTVTTLAGVVMALPRYRRPLVDGSHWIVRLRMPRLVIYSPWAGPPLPRTLVSGRIEWTLSCRAAPSMPPSGAYGRPKRSASRIEG